MFATRADQENLAYAHQTTAAAKPLNQRADAKTPGPRAPKTPFRTNRQDENVVHFGKNAPKTGGKANLDAFVTPAGPRTRAPLGMKTTNAKAAAFQTPAPPSTIQKSAKSTQKPVSPRLRRGKVKIHQAETVPVDLDDGVPEVEYMPPKSVPLPDYPDDIHELDFERIFNPEEAYRSMAREALDPMNEDGLRESEIRYKRFMQETDEAAERQIQEGLARDPYARYGNPELERLYAELQAKDALKAAKATSSHNRTPSTLASKTAASTLSRQHAPSSTTPRFAAPTAATATKVRAPAPSKAVLGNRSVNTTHANAAATSRSTLGYAKGRAVSASKRQPLSPAHQAPVVKKRTGTGPASVGAENPFKGTPFEHLLDDDGLEEMLRKGFSETDGNEDLAGGMNGLDLADEEDDATKDFVLEMPDMED